MEIYITGQQMSGEDMDRAMKAPASELPKLTDKKEKAAAVMQVPPDRWARYQLAGQYSKERLRKTAERMAATIERELVKVAPEAKAEFLQYEVGPEPHRLMLIHDGKTTWVDIPSDDDSDEALVEICKGTAIMLKA